MNKLEQIKKEFREKWVSKLMVDDGNNKLLWNDKAPTPNEVWDFIEKTIKEVERSTGVLDIHGIEIKEGDIVGVPHVYPFGQVGDDLSYKAKVSFRNGAFFLDYIDYGSYTENVLLFNWLEKETGEYVPNYGNKKIVRNTSLLKILDKQETGGGE